METKIEEVFGINKFESSRGNGLEMLLDLRKIREQTLDLM